MIIFYMEFMLGLKLTGTEYFIVILTGKRTYNLKISTLQYIIIFPRPY
jgi:hypothetical protein